MMEGEVGIASWYGHPYHGRRTASGEIYNMHDFTAAHRTLPFDTRVKVCNLENGKEVVVRINDRGPFVEGRVIDLSFAAAQALSITGVAQVRLALLGSAPSKASSGFFSVQVGAFRNRENAERLKATIGRYFRPVFIQEFDRGDGYFYRVRVGQANSEAAAQQLGRDLARANLATETFVVRID